MSFVGPIKASPVVSSSGTFQTQLQLGTYTVAVANLPPPYFAKSMAGSKSLSGNRLTVTGEDSIEIIVTIGVLSSGI